MDLYDKIKDIMQRAEQPINAEHIITQDHLQEQSITLIKEAHLLLTHQSCNPSIEFEAAKQYYLQKVREWATPERNSIPFQYLRIHSPQQNNGPVV